MIDRRLCMSSKYLKIVTVLAGIVLSGNTLADSVLIVGDNVVVTQIDDQKISNGFISKPIRKFRLPAGNHKISAKYKRLYDLTADDHDIVRSTELTVSAPMQDGQRYQLVMADQPEDYEAAVTYAEKPTLSIVKDGAVVVKQTAITGSTGFLGGVGSSIGQIFTGTRKSGDAVVVNTTNASQPASSKPTSNQSTLDQFMRIWLQATPTERIKIKNWVKDQ